MDYNWISYILAVLTIILVLIGFVLIIYITYKYEKKAYENPNDAEKLRERRKVILKTYLRLVIAIFILAIVTKIMATS